MLASRTSSRRINSRMQNPIRTYQNSTYCVRLLRLFSSSEQENPVGSGQNRRLDSQSGPIARQSDTDDDTSSTFRRQPRVGRYLENQKRGNCFAKKYFLLDKCFLKKSVGDNNMKCFTENFMKFACAPQEGACSPIMHEIQLAANARSMPPAFGSLSLTTTSTSSTPVAFMTAT